MIGKPPLKQPRCSACEDEKNPGELVNLTLEATYIDIKPTRLTCVCVNCVGEIVAMACAVTKAKHGL